MDIIKKGWDIQKNIETKRLRKKQARIKRYNDFLANPPRQLPPLETLIKLRYALFLMTFSVMTIPTIQILCFNNSLYTMGFDFIPTACILFAIPISGMMATIDYAIYKRFKKHNWINW